MPLSRRQFLSAAAGTGALLVAGPGGIRAGLALGGVESGGASRTSRLFSDGRFVVHTDLHNHSVLSGDAVADPAAAFEQFRQAGLDVASLTEHAIMGRTHGQVTCRNGPCKAFVGMTDADWARVRSLADEANDDGHFVTVHGFEWTTGTLGHLNVWFTREWIDGLQAGALVTPRGATQLGQVLPVPEEVAAAFAHAPDTASMAGFYDWLTADPDRPVLGGGADGVAGFNHPNQFGNFDGYAYEPAAAPQLVSCEALNGTRDFFFYGTDEGQPFPLNACLNAGWRVGLVGVSDEHGNAFGVAGKARGGLWVSELTRAGVLDAMRTRRMFATFEPGLRLDAAAAGVPMGGVVSHGRGPMRIDLDIDRGPAWYGKPLVVQVIRPGSDAPTVAAAEPVTVPTPDEPPLQVGVDVDIADGDWLFLRIVDPDRAPDPAATGPFDADGGAVAYASPFFLEPPAG
jgi:hypothetical protein